MPQRCTGAGATLRKFNFPAFVSCGYILSYPAIYEIL